MIKDYFKTIDREDKAYWLGFIYADGCISSDLKTIIIELSAKDLKHIEKFKEAIEASQNIQLYERKGVKFARICIGCKEMVGDLISKGCHPHKTFDICFPNFSIVHNKFIKHFIRGLFDGDGCISSTKRKRNNSDKLYNIYTLSFLGTESLLNGINANLPFDDMNIFKKQNVYCMKTQSKDKIIKVLDYLYDNSNVYLERKYEKYNQIKCI